MADAPFTHEELERIRQRATKYALDADDASIRIAVQTLGEAAANLAAKLPGSEAPDPFEDAESA